SLFLTTTTRTFQQTILTYTMIITTLFVFSIVAIILDVPQQCLESIRNQFNIPPDLSTCWHLATPVLFLLWLLEKRRKQVPVKVVKVQQVEKRSNFDAEVASLRRDLNRILDCLQEEYAL